MKIMLADSAGFCFGVNRAVNEVENLLGSGIKVATLGPLIHNPSYIKSLQDRGVILVDSIKEVPHDYELVIRAHGVTKEIIEEVKDSKIKYSDATCPFVKKIQKIVDNHSTPNNTVIIAGDENHPEVKGFRSYCKGKSYVFKNEDELKKLIDEHPEIKDSELIYVAQTTFSTDEYKKCSELIKKGCTNVKKFATICDATSKRQKDACNLSLICDIIIIIGGRMSSNTQKLKGVCEKNARTYLIESAEELSDIDFSGCSTVGVTAGASTPVCIIKEVLKTMSETINNPVESSEAEGQAVADSEMSFEQALEESLKSLNSDQKVVGTVLRVTPTEIQVDIGRKQTGIVPNEEYSADPNADPSSEVNVGDQLNLIIMKTNDADGFITLSKKRYDSQANWDEVAAAKDSDEVLNGTVTEILNKGVIAITKGVRVFIPASQATLSRNDKLEDLLGQAVQFKIIDSDNRRRRAVGSISVVLKEARKASREAFWAQVEIGQKYEGTVVSLTEFGAFVEIAPGVQGLCHKSELSWNRIKHPSEIVNVGDKIDVTIKDFNPETRKISLTYKKIEDSPWEVLKRDYPVGSVIDVQIVSLTTFGAFAQIIPHIQGLIHISQIANHRVEKPQDELNIGDTVKVMITGIDFEKKHVSLSIRALLTSEEATAEEEAEDEVPEGTAIPIEELLAKAEAEAAAENAAE
ncbi:MAG: bifunctional 4-hydroxy-3-methylbut-2-enyl diphosphate reductase/30S ribosomal protein S1 [Clostridiales bacterium]|nr:bifunctional 4-hydroxy-3-methylbut-2-enyl diphosphate reductase/30S ribosomal protein S1 [Clostridiales bacterium]